jgi:TctA family transporter
LLPFVLFIGTPAVSAALAGWTLGKPLLDPASVSTPRSAAFRGAVIASFALLLFAPLFATIYVCTQPVTEHWSMLSLTFLVLIGSALTAWFKVALIGAVVGWVLSSMGLARSTH